MATNFFELATTLKNLGAKWLSEKKVNFTPCIRKYIEHSMENMHTDVRVERVKDKMVVISQPLDNNFVEKVVVIHRGE